MSSLRLSVTFLSGMYHGRGDNGAPEWPPSPLRLFQALLAVAAARWRTPLPSDVAEALDWLAGLAPPEIVTPPHQVGTPYQTAVPNNAMDIVAKAWSRGNETSKDAQPATHKAMKQFRPTHLLADNADGASVIYSWRLDQPETDESRRHIAAIRDLAARLYQFGWGLDLVAGYAEVANGEAFLPGEQWFPTSGVGSRLRTPQAVTRGFLEDRHRRFLDRLSKRTLIPVPPLPNAAYDVVSYRRSIDPAPLSFAAFSLLETDGSGYRAFPRTGGCKVAGMLRHAVAETARSVGWSEATVKRLVLGHAESRGAERHEPVGRERLAYVPLPSLERRRPEWPPQHVGMIRRALIYVPAGGHEAELNTLRRMLSGCELVDTNGVSEGLISLLPASDVIVRRYCPVTPATRWSTVTPVVLPGHDDRRERKTESLLRKAVCQAGYADELAQQALIDWRGVGYWPGAERIDRYFVPKHLRNLPRYHVRIQWRDSQGQPLAIPGPLVLGGGRYCGLGLFAAEADGRGPV